MQDIQLMQQLALLHSADPVEQSELDAHWVSGPTDSQKA